MSESISLELLIKNQIISILRQNLNSFDLDSNAKLYLVGGVVRDIILGKANRDIDIVYLPYTHNNAFENFTNFTSNFYAILTKTFTDMRIKNNQNPITCRIYNNDYNIDITMARREMYNTPNLVPAFSITTQLYEDYIRRDFTANSLYIDIKTLEIVDFTSSLEDIRNLYIKCNHNNCLKEDMVRVIRMFKLVVISGFRVHKSTYKLLEAYENSNALDDILTNSKRYSYILRRLKYEIDKILDTSTITNVDKRYIIWLFFKISLSTRRLLNRSQLFQSKSKLDILDILEI